MQPGDSSIVWKRGSVQVGKGLNVSSAVALMLLADDDVFVSHPDTVARSANLPDGGMLLCHFGVLTAICQHVRIHDTPALHRAVSKLSSKYCNKHPFLISAGDKTRKQSEQK